MLLRRSFQELRLYILAAVSLWPGMAPAGEILKIDDAVIVGDITTFDGHLLTIDTQKPEQSPQTIPIEEITSIRLSGDGSLARQKADAPGNWPLPVPPLPAPPLQVIAPPANEVANTPISLPPAWQVRLINGDQLTCELRSWNDERVRVEQEYSSTVYNIPQRFVSEMWRPSVKLILKAKSLKSESLTEDVAYVIKDADIISVKGTVLGVNDDALTFRYEGQDRKISLNRLLGLVLLPQKPTAADAAAQAAFHQAFKFKTDDQISGHWDLLQHDAITVTTLWDQKLVISATQIDSIDTRNGPLVYLSELKPAKVEQTPYFDRIMPWRNDKNLDGKPLKLGNLTYEHGIAMHSRCVLEYDLNGQFTSFKTRLGLEQLLGALGRVSIRVTIDGRPLFENSDLRSDQKPQDLDLDIRNGKRLVLEVGFGEDQDVADRVIWANARLIRSQSGK